MEEYEEEVIKFNLKDLMATDQSPSQQAARKEMFEVINSMVRPKSTSDMKPLPAKLPDYWTVDFRSPSEGEDQNEG